MTRNRRPTRTVTLPQLARILRRIKGAQPLAFTAVTKCDIYASSPWGAIYKAQRVQAFTGASYERSVNRALAKRGVAHEFVPGTRAWGEKVAPALVQKGDEQYLAVHVLNRGRPVYVTSQGRDLTVVTPDVVADHLKIRAPRLVYGVQAVERRDFALRSLAFVSVMGHRYRVRAQTPIDTH